MALTTEILSPLELGLLRISGTESVGTGQHGVTNTNQAMQPLSVATGTHNVLHAAAAQCLTVRTRAARHNVMAQTTWASMYAPASKTGEQTNKHGVTSAAQTTCSKRKHHATHPLPGSETTKSIAISMQHDTRLHVHRGRQQHKTTLIPASSCGEFAAASSNARVRTGANGGVIVTVQTACSALVRTYVWDALCIRWGNQPC